jgi:hypothetical protein
VLLLLIVMDLSSIPLLLLTLILLAPTLVPFRSLPLLLLYALLPV